MSASSKGKPRHEFQAIAAKESEFIDSTIRRIAKENAFGQGQLVSITGKEIDDKGCHFMSKIDFKTVIMENDDGNQKEVPLVIKIQIEFIDNDRGASSRGHLWFSNEVNMFNDILPFLRGNDIDLFPYSYYCKMGDSSRMDIVIIEDLTKQNFHLLEQTVAKKERMTFLVRKLGQFHGLCYRAKLENPEVIERFKTVLKATKHFCANTPPIDKEISLIIAERLNDDSADLKRLMTHLRKERNILMDMRLPEEPFATIVHSDLFNSNILIRSEDDQITDARFIDLQTVYYSDPAFDFSFFVFMCASVDLIESNWDDFVEDYWYGITSVVSRPGFNREQMKNNIERKALSGFMDACFFLPLITTRPDNLGPPPTGAGGIETHLTNAPPEAANKLISILKFAVKRGFVAKALESFDQ